MNTQRIICILHASNSSIPYGIHTLLKDSVESKFMHIKVKTASLRWHSPMLDDISAVSLGWIPSIVDICEALLLHR